MNIRGSTGIYCLFLVLVLLCTVWSAGCTSPQKKAPEQPLLQVTPEISRDQNPAQQPAFGSQTGMTTVVLDHGVTVSYPVDWNLEKKGGYVVRDYGRNVIHIADITSPDITSDRAASAAPNPDKSRYTTLSIEVDPVATADFERYFNLATLAVDNRYESVEITKRNVVLRISITNKNPAGYKSYELDFDTDTMRGKYIFTNVDGTIYIFAFRNPSPYSKEIEDIYKSVIISHQEM